MLPSYCIWGGILIQGLLFKATIAVISFCLMSSCVYIINDIRDCENDKKHQKKCLRPIPHGDISVSNALIVGSVCFLVSILVSILFVNYICTVLLLIYILVNIVYSFWGKNIPVIDLGLLTACFVIRVVYGGCATNIKVSGWLYLVVLSGSLFMALGKRRNEFVKGCDTRTVLRSYNESFLNNNMYVSLCLCEVFYSLWAIENTNKLIKYTIPMFMFVLMLYSLDVENDIDGDPIEIILGSRKLFIGSCIYGVTIFLFLYLLP